MADTLHLPLKFPFTNAAGRYIERLPIRRIKRKDIATAQAHAKGDEGMVEDHLLARMTGLALEDLGELDIADNKQVADIFRQMADGGDLAEILGRSPAVGAEAAAE